MKDCIIIIYTCCGKAVIVQTETGSGCNTQIIHTRNKMRHCAPRTAALHPVPLARATAHGHAILYI